MKKTLLLSNQLLCIFAVSTFLVACQKQESEKTQRRAFKANLDTWYRIAPITTPSPVTVGENSFMTFAYVPGGGEGNATHMGNVKTWFNQLAYTDDLTAQPPQPRGSVSAAAIDAANYPVIGLPLPLIQPGEFSGLTALISAYNIPASINGKMITSFLYNTKGDVVFISNSTPSIITPASPTRNDFAGKALIVGGRGKFLNATGEVDFTGWFDPTNPNNATYNVDGWISY